MTPQRVTVTDMGQGARKVILACTCVKVGRVITAWEPLEETVAQLAIDHHRPGASLQAPRSGRPPAVATAPWSAPAAGRAARGKGVIPGEHRRATDTGMTEPRACALREISPGCHTGEGTRAVGVRPSTESWPRGHAQRDRHRGGWLASLPRPGPMDPSSTLVDPSPGLGHRKETERWPVEAPHPIP